MTLNLQASLLCSQMFFKGGPVSIFLFPFPLFLFPLLPFFFFFWFVCFLIDPEKGAVNR